MTPLSRGPARRPRFLVTVLLALVTGALAACGRQNAMGEANSLIVVMSDSVWAEVEETTYAVLEPTIFTTRDEKQYNVTQIDPTDPAFSDLRLFRNLIVTGASTDPLMREVADAGGLDLNQMESGRVFQVENVWATGQIVTGVLVRQDSRAMNWERALPSVLAAVDESYRDWVLRRMFATPPDTALANDLEERFGFRILVPQVYDRVVREGAEGDSLVILRNDNPDPNVLIRSLLIAWEEGVDSLTAEGALQWRASIDDIQYNVAQGIDDSGSTVTRFQIDGQEALEVTGVWRDEVGNFPAAGPFVVWMVRCADRTYYIDAWLYAPNEPKYEYMLQIQEILGSFRCGG